jgi:hypothetical protein
VGGRGVEWISESSAGTLALGPGVHKRTVPCTDSLLPSSATPRSYPCPPAVSWKCWAIDGEL